MVTRIAAAVGAALPLVFTNTPALAQWEGWFQWGTQGSYVHQFAHLLFLGAMLVFIWELYKGDLREWPGFRCIVWACWLLAWWNLDAIWGHALEWSLLNPVIMGQGFSRRLLMEDLHTWLFYLTKITHFVLLVPAFYLLYRGLRAMAAKIEAGRS
jgi:hypothetical protein|uniref:Uncharacterized protein n=1 Tax=Desulfobacca acetoxidans TaxID=60893 RepID=A0A7C5AK96_9BACT